jgi:hypothetical protein
LLLKIVPGEVEVYGRDYTTPGSKRFNPLGGLKGEDELLQQEDNDAGQNEGQQPERNYFTSKKKRPALRWLTREALMTDGEAGEKYRVNFGSIK